MQRITEKRGIFSRRWLLLLLPALLLAAACGVASDTEDAGNPALLPLPQVVSTLSCIENGRLAGRLYGAVDGEILWDADEMSCEGMPRPNGEGARLRFAGPHPSGEGTLVFIAAIPAVERNTPANELTTRLTIINEGDALCLIAEGDGRFFTSPDFEICWTDIVSDEAIDTAIDDVSDDVSDDSRRRVSGRIYCITPLNEVNGSATVTLSDIAFTGLIDWSKS